MANDQAKGRTFYLDFLRALAIFAVIVLHLSVDQAGQYDKLPTPDWLSAAFYNGLTRWCVPMFVLISGALLLKPNKQVRLEELFRSRLPRLVIPLVVWSVIYEIFQFTTDKGYGQFHLLPALKIFYQGPVVFHFWFLYMMIGIYLIYPVINAFVSGATKSLVQYFILIWFMVNCVLGIMSTMLDLNIGIELYSFTGYIGYFVLGYYLNSYSFNHLKLIYTLAVVAAGASIAGIVLLQTRHLNFAGSLIESDFTPDIPIFCTGLFLLLKNYIFNINDTRWKSLVAQISKESYGIYIVHVLFLRLLFDKTYLGMGFTNVSLFWLIPLKALVVLILSFGLTKLIRLVPGLRATV